MKLLPLIFTILTCSIFAETDPFAEYYENKKFESDKNYKGKLNCPFKHNSLYKMPPRPSCIVFENEPKFEIVCSKCFYYYEPTFKIWSHFHSAPKTFSMPISKLLNNIKIPKQELIKEYKNSNLKIFTNKPKFRQSLKGKITEEEYLEYRTLENYSKHLTKLKSHLNNQNIKNLKYIPDKKKLNQVRFKGTWQNYKVSGILYEFKNHNEKLELVFAISIEKIKTE